MQTGNTDFIYKDELDKSCFQHDMAYGKSKDLIKITQSHKVLRDKEFKIQVIRNMMVTKEDWLQWFISFLIKTSGSGITEPNYQLADELHKPIIRKFKKRKVYSSFRDNIWGLGLADMQSLSKYNKGTKYLLCTIDLFSKHAWFVPVKDKRGASIANGFQKIISKGRKPNKIWVDQGSKFYNSSFKNFLKINNIEMYSTFNEGKSVVAERFIKTLKNKIYKYVTAISKNVFYGA